MIHMLEQNKRVHTESETEKVIPTQDDKPSTSSEDSISWQGNVQGPRPILIQPSRGWKDCQHELMRLPFSTKSLKPKKRNILSHVTKQPRDTDFRHSYIQMLKSSENQFSPFLVFSSSLASFLEKFLLGVYHRMFRLHNFSAFPEENFSYQLILKTSNGQAWVM